MPRKLEIYQPTGRSREELNLLIIEQANQEVDPVIATENPITSTLIESNVPIQETITLTPQLSTVMKFFTQAPDQQLSISDIQKSTGLQLFSLIPCLNVLKNKKLLACSDSDKWGISPDTDISKLVFTETTPDQKTSQLPSTPPTLIEKEISIVIPSKPVDIPQPRLPISEVQSQKKAISKEPIKVDHQAVLAKSLEKQSNKKPNKITKKRGRYKIENSEIRLKENEKKVLEVITASVRTTGWSPPVRKIQQEANIKAISTVNDILFRLESFGFLCRDSKADNLWLPTSFDPETDPKIKNLRKYNRVHSYTNKSSDSKDKSTYKNLILQMDQNKLPILDFISDKYPISQLRDKLKLIRTIHQNSIEQILLALILKPSEDPIEDLSNTIRSIKQLNFTPQIIKSILAELPTLFPKLPNIPILSLP